MRISEKKEEGRRKERAEKGRDSQKYIYPSALRPEKGVIAGGPVSALLTDSLGA
jgi:hypothetical protein